MTGNHIQAVGDVIGERYVIEGYVNQGGMQEVYKAHDMLLGRNVALKVPKNASATKRFKRSAVVSARVNHANVAKTLDYLEEGSKSYLIEEFIEGRDLSYILKNNFQYIDPLIASWILHRLAKGIASSHRVGVIHRDLKPSNIMVEGGELITSVKITDFGIAKLAEEELADAIQGGDESLTASQTAIGALPYMAPEMIEDIKSVTTAVDVWSLGALAYELLTGKKPFGSGLRAVTAIQRSDPQPITIAPARKPQFSSAADDVGKLVFACLNKNANERPTAIELVAKCETLFYPTVAREFGIVRRMPNNYWGFITSSRDGKDVFFHVDSVYCDVALKEGDRVSFARHDGGGSDRAFPVVKTQ